MLSGGEGCVGQRGLGDYAGELERGAAVRDVGRAGSGGWLLHAYEFFRSSRELSRRLLLGRLDRRGALSGYILELFSKLPCELPGLRERFGKTVQRSAARPHRNDFPLVTLLRQKTRLQRWDHTRFYER